MTSTTNKRRESILEELERHQTVNVSELSKQFGVSEVSIRRDLDRLEQLGRLKRVHGGAVVMPDSSLGQSLAEKMRQQIKEKERIGRAAAKLVQVGERVIFDSGTTVSQVARNISNDLLTTGSLTAITASIPIIQELGHSKGVQLFLLGGIYLPEHQTVVGPPAVQSLKGLYADKLFLGTDGLTFTHGVTTANMLEAEVNKTMVESAGQVIVVADSSKIDVVGFATIVPITKIDILITDTSAPSSFIERLREQGVDIILA